MKTNQTKSNGARPIDVTQPRTIRDARVGHRLSVFRAHRFVNHDARPRAGEQWGLERLSISSARPSHQRRRSGRVSIPSLNQPTLDCTPRPTLVRIRPAPVHTHRLERHFTTTRSTDVQNSLNIIHPHRRRRSHRRRIDRYRGKPRRVESRGDAREDG